MENYRARKKERMTELEKKENRHKGKTQHAISLCHLIKDI